MHIILRRVNSTLETGSNIVGSQISRQVALRDSRETPGELDNVVVAVSERPLAATSQTSTYQQQVQHNVLILHHAVLKIISTSIKCVCYANKMHSGQNITNFSIVYIHTTTMVLLAIECVIIFEWFWHQCSSEATYTLLVFMNVFPCQYFATF